MQYATSEKTYWQPSCKASIQGTVFITGSLGHPQLPLNSSVNLMSLGALLLELFLVEYGLRERFAKSGTNFRLPYPTFRRHNLLVVSNILIKFWFCASIWWTNTWTTFERNMKLKVGGSG